ncbi:MAG TPA: hypothetical protein VE913_18780, partial [Longimicrobium sp.]|nr:hypothetical protein [Longimicrobium sp.]
MTFQRYENGLYLTQAGVADPTAARVGFLFQDATRTDPTFELSRATWTDAANQGYFAFFAPSATRDWRGFAAALRTQFAGNAPAQFGWFPESGAPTLVMVASQGTPAPWVQSAFTLTFNNVTLVMQANPFAQPTIAFDDTGNAFQIANAGSSAIQLTAAAPNQSGQTFQSGSPFLTLAMDDGGAHGGSVSADFAFATTDLAAFEAGFMYFAPPEAGLVTALSYPAFRAAAGDSAAMAFGAWLDVLNPLDGARSYFQFTDGALGSYFATGTGGTLALTTTNGSDPTLTSRLVFANRPVAHPTDTGTYYLTPAGAFALATATAPRANLLCGVTGTEFMDVATAGTPDTLVIEPGQPAYQQATPASGPGREPVFLDSVDGNVTTSWVRVVTGDGKYVSQPQASPLYQQGESGGEGDSGLNLYLLDFLPLATWQAATPSGALDAAPTSTPLVPMAPYAGLVLSSADLAAPYLAIESTALNPTRKNAFTGAWARADAAARAAGTLAAFEAATDAAQTWAMTPQGLLAGLDANQAWTATRVAVSTPPSGVGSEYLELDAMSEPVRQALQQNQIFLVVTSLDNPNAPPAELFDFTNDGLNISGWPFSLSPGGTPSSDGTPPILILKFYPGQSIAELAADINLWSQAFTFNSDAAFTPSDAQAYIQGQIRAACESVYGAGNCPGGTPSGTPDTSSLYYNFHQTVTDPEFSGVLALNANMQLTSLPTAIRAVTGGMTVPGDDGPVSNIDAFRVHHVGVAINDTDPDATVPTLARSSLFGLVDYEKPATDAVALAGNGVTTDYNFEVEYLRALFTNSELSSFACKVNLTINKLFETDVKLNEEASTALLRAGDADANVVAITGSYQAHSTSGDDSTSGEGVYSFMAEGNFAFTFGDNPYLDSITLTKLQFSFLQEEPATSTRGDGTTSTIQASFGIWGAMVFKKFDVLDIFALDQLVFNDLGIAVRFDLTTYAAPKAPVTSGLALSFAPGNLRLDLAASTPREGATSMLQLLPFKLTSFLYNQFPDQQTLEDLQYFSLAGVPLGKDLSLTDQFNYGLIFELDLGSWGALAGPLQAFKFSFIVGWLTAEGSAGRIAFGVRLPQANGKLEITIQGVLKLVIQQFVLQYQTGDNGAGMLVLSLHNSMIEILGQRLPPGEARFFDFALFAPIGNASRIGWIAAINSSGGGGGDIERARAGGTLLTDAVSGERMYGSRVTPRGDDGDGGKSPVFDLVYLGLGQRVGPDPTDPPTTFADFLDFMNGDFWAAVSSGEYDKVYHPDGQWLALTNFKILGIIEVGFIFYDVTPFYSLTLNVEKLFNFEITYTKVSDTIGLFYANFSLPDSLRTFQVGAASLTLPSIGVSVYTNGNWKLDVGFPAGDDWSRSFAVQAQAGPVPVTGAGGFYIASLSSATSPNTFTGTYPSIVAFGFAARLGVGKDFTAGPLKAGVSVTFFGIVEGAAGYLSSGSTEIFRTPDALSLSGQFGIIGELYGSIDFVIIKASVNVRLQASIGIVLKYERAIPNSGSILLYIEASVSVSVKVEIDLGLFSISISFRFNASFRFEWQLLPAGGGAQRFLACAPRRHLLLGSQVAVLPLLPGLTANLALWFLPEGTVVFPAATGTGTPWLATSLGIEFDASPQSGAPPYARFKPFEALAAQLATWAVGQALALDGGTYTVTLDQVRTLDSDPAELVGWIDYPTLLSQLAVFDATTLTTPDGSVAGSASAATFPMPPFLQLRTTGRRDGNGAPAELDFVYATQNVVSTGYITEVDAYFNQLFVNQASGGADALTATTLTDGTTPLVQEVFLNYFTALVRGAVHAVLQRMQDSGATTGTIDALIQAAVGAGLFQSLAGQMSASFRGGARLPYTAGLTVPGGDALPTTNPLFALLWQEFPVGAAAGYTVALANPDSTQGWLTVTASWTLTPAWLQPFQEARATDVVAPGAPAQIPFTDVGPQSFAYGNPTVWTQPGAVTTTLFPFPSNLARVQAATPGNVSVLVRSRPAGAPYGPSGTDLAPSAFTWATRITLTAAGIPSGTGTAMLPDLYSLAGASQGDQALLERILGVLANGTDPVAAIQILYQTAAGAAGLNSATVAPSDVFVLRTNTTTVSAPPAGLNLQRMLAATAPTPVPVGASLGDAAGFLQIVRQAAVTNAPGYYLRYVDSSGNGLPTELFAGGPAPVTLLITYAPDGSGNTPASPALVAPYYNAIAIDGVEAGLLYSANTTEVALGTQYAVAAPGSMGIVLTQSDRAARMQPSAGLGLRHDNAARGLVRSEMIDALARAGIRDEAEVRARLAASGSGAAQLNALYSLVTYQVTANAAFVASNLSAPVQPQQPDAGSSAADGLIADDDTSSFRVYVPLYKLAVSNQGVTTRPPNRYAEIGGAVGVEFHQNDAFGNQMPAAIPFASTNGYFDAIIGVEEWQGVVTAYDFGAGTQASTFTVYLEPSAAAFAAMTPDQAAAALQSYYTIQDQLTGPGVTLRVETNLALHDDGSMASVALSPAQTAAVTAMIGGIVTYLEGFQLPAPAFDVAAVPLAITVGGGGTEPPVFELAVLLGIERDIDLIAPSLVNGGVVTYPAAQNRYSNIVPTVGASLPDGGGSVSISTFAASFVAAFPALLLAVGLGGAG